MKKTKKHLEAALAEADARIDRLRDELTTTRRLNDELRESLVARNSAYDALKKHYHNTDEHIRLTEHRVDSVVGSANSERRAWMRLHSVEMSRRINNETLIGNLRWHLRDARARLDRFTECAKELDKNRANTANGVLVTNTDLLELKLQVTNTEFFIKDPVLKQLLNWVENPKWDEADSN